MSTGNKPRSKKYGTKLNFCLSAKLLRPFFTGKKKAAVRDYFRFYKFVFAASPVNKVNKSATLDTHQGWPALMERLEKLSRRRLRLKVPYVWNCNALQHTKHPLGNMQTRWPLRQLVKARLVAHEVHFVLRPQRMLWCLRKQGLAFDFPCSGYFQI